MKMNADRATFAIVLLCAGFVALSFFRNGSGGSCALIPFENQTDAVPTAVDSWTLTDLEGQVHRARDYRDRPYIMTFWATWCVNCRREMPAFNQLHDQLTGRGADVVSVNLDDGAVDPVRSFVQATGINYPVLRADSDHPLPFHLQAVPTTLVIAPGGTVLKEKVGAIESDEILALLAPYLTDTTR